MTLEYIKKHLYNTDIFPTRDGIVKDICNVFESKTCENCELFENNYCNHIDNEQIGTWVNRMQVYPSFGCPKFKRKTDGNTVL